MTSQLGVLAIFNDCLTGCEKEFEEWFQGEHLIERLGVPGFLFGRRHKALSGSSGYFNFYLVETPDVLTSKPYLERLDQPTPMTHEIMSKVFIHMNRTVCRRAVRRGKFRGAFAVTARFNQAPDESRLLESVEKLAADTSIASAEIWIALDPAGMPVSKEEQLRGGDKKIRGALMIDTLYADRANAVFQVLCQIGRGDI
jgi:hypothetical protein